MSKRKKKKKYESSIDSFDFLDSKKEKGELVSLSEGKFDFGDSIHSEAITAAQGRFSGWRYQKLQGRLVEAIEEEKKVLKALAAGIEARTEYVEDVKGYYMATGQVDKLPGKERKEVLLAEREVDTKLLRQQAERTRQETDLLRLRKEQIEIWNEIKKLEQEDMSPQPVMSEDEKYQMLTEKEQRKEEHKLGLVEMRERKQRESLRRSVESDAKFRREMGEKFPERVDEIIDEYERKQVNAGLKEEG